MVAAEANTVQPESSVGKPLATAGLLAGIWGLFQWLVPMTPAVRGGGWLAMAMLAALLVCSLRYSWLTPAKRIVASISAVAIVCFAAWWWWPVPEPSPGNQVATESQVPAITMTPSVPTAAEIADQVIEKLPVGRIQLEGERVTEPVTTTSPAIPHPSAQRLSLYSQYAYEWSNYRDAKATGVPRDEARDIEPSTPLRKPFGNGEHLLALGIANYNFVPLEASLIIVRPDNVTIEFGGCWVWVTGRTYRCVLGEGPQHQIDALTGLHANYQLKAKFPRPDTYEFEYTLKPTGLPDAKVDTFTVVLEP